MSGGVSLYIYTFLEIVVIWLQASRRKGFGCNQGVTGLPNRLQPSQALGFFVTAWFVAQLTMVEYGCRRPTDGHAHRHPSQAVTCYQQAP